MKAKKKGKTSQKKSCWTCDYLYSFTYGVHKCKKTKENRSLLLQETCKHWKRIKEEVIGK